MQLEADLDAPIAIVGIGLKAPGGAQGNLVGKDAFWKVRVGHSLLPLELTAHRLYILG
jgi:hypothetical protein